MSEPFEQKYRQVRLNLTAKKIEADALRGELRHTQNINMVMNHRLELAQNALFKAGWRRLDDLTWTDLPFEEE